MLLALLWRIGEYMRGLLHDLVMVALAGLAGICGLFVVLFISGMLLNEFHLQAGLMLVQSGMLIAGSMGLLLCAGFLLKPQSAVQIRENPQWKRYFYLFGLFPVAAGIAFEFLAVAVWIDYYLHF